MPTFQVLINVHVPGDSAEAAVTRISQELRTLFGQNCLDSFSIQDNSQDAHVTDDCVSLSPTVHVDSNRQLMIEVSTAHVPRSTSIALGESENFMNSAELSNKLVYSNWHSCGWIIFCCEDSAHEIRDDHPELSKLINMCTSRQITYLKLDADCEYFEDFPTFNW